MSLEAKKAMIKKERYWSGTCSGETLRGGCGGFGSDLLTMDFIKEFHKEVGYRDKLRLRYQGRLKFCDDANEINSAGHVCFYDGKELYKYNIERCHQHSKNKDLMVHYYTPESTIQVARNSNVDFFILIKKKQKTAITYKKIARGWTVHCYHYDSIETMAKAIYGLTRKELEYIRKRDKEK